MNSHEPTRHEWLAFIGAVAVAVLVAALGVG